MGLLDLLKTSNGDIPFIQIVVGILLGILGTFLYLKVYKPLMCCDNEAKTLTEPLLENENFVPTLVEPENLPKVPTESQKSFNDLETKLQEEEENEEELLPYNNEPDEIDHEYDNHEFVQEKIHELE